MANPISSITPIAGLQLQPREAIPLNINGQILPIVARTQGTHFFQTDVRLLNPNPVAKEFDLFFVGTGNHDGSFVGTGQTGANAFKSSRIIGPGQILNLTDVVMSCYSGPELASRLRVRFPEMPVVYMSGYGREEGGYRRLPQDAVFLQKPFSPEELIDTVSVTLGKQARVGTDVEPPMMLEPLQTVPFDVEPH